MRTEKEYENRFQEDLGEDWLADEWADEDDEFEEMEEHSRSPYAGMVKEIIAEAALLFAIIIAIAAFQNWNNNPKRVAEEYVKRTVQGEWNEAFQYLYFEEGEDPLLSQKMFVTAQGVHVEQADIVRSKIQKVKDISGNNTLFQVDYTRNEEVLKKEVPLKKVNGRWMIDGNKEFVQKKAQIMAPKDTAVYYDEMLLPKEYIVSSENNVDLYELPVIFKGLHYIEAEKTDMEKVERLVEFQEEPVLIEMKYSQELLKKAGMKAQEDIKAGYEKAEIGRTLFLSLKLTGNRITAKTVGEDGKRIEVTVDSQYEYKYKPNKYYRRVRTENGSVRNVCTYAYDGNGFILEKIAQDAAFLRKDGGQS